MKTIIFSKMKSKNFFFNVLVTLILISVAFSAILSVNAQAQIEQPPEEYRGDVISEDDVKQKQTIKEASFGYAWGDPDGPHSVYDWPYTFDQMGLVIQSYQNYSSGTSAAYFHHGIDMVVNTYNNNLQVFNRSGGQVINIENYQPGNSLYWEVAILDPEGYVWQYHHIDQPTIPQLIYTKFAEWQADPVNGGFIPPNTHIGNIVYWPVVSLGYRFNHIHLNILGDGDVYLNTLEFHTPIVDTQIPEIQAIGLLNGNTVVSGTIAPANYGLYVRARDLYQSPVYYLPPYKTEFSLDGGEWITVWEFHDLPGGSDDNAFVNDFYVPVYTKGNYDQRDFYIDLGFTTSGQRVFPTAPGQHTIDVRVWDYFGNSTQSAFSWLVPQSIPDNGCSGGNGLTRTFEFDEDLVVTDVNLGVNISHASRGQLRVTLKAPNDSSATTIINTASDTYDNYDVLVDDASANPLNDSSNDTVALPYFDRTAGPSTNGSLDSFNGKSALGTWTVFVCDNTGSTTGTLNLLDLQIQGTPAVNNPPVAYAQTVAAQEDTPQGITLTGSDPDADPIWFTVTSTPVHGVLSGYTPDLTYTPVENYFGTDSFTFVASDGQLSSDPAVVTINISPVNDAPIANPQSLSTSVNTPLPITLTASDIEGDLLSYQVTSSPSHGSLSGTAPSLTYTPDVGFIGSDSFSFTASDASLVSQEAVIDIAVISNEPIIVFSDDFETNQGWVRNPYGSDTAPSAGRFERANPGYVYFYGDKQLGTTVSGSYDLVTGSKVGRSSGTYDLDGITSMMSPQIALPAGRGLTLSFYYYFAHHTNSTSSDYLRVKVVGTTTTMVFEELGAADNDNAVWELCTVDISAFAGQSVTILVEAGDIGMESLVEAALDDFLITAN